MSTCSSSSSSGILTPQSSCSDESDDILLPLPFQFKYTHIEDPRAGTEWRRTPDEGILIDVNWAFAKDFDVTWANAYPANATFTKLKWAPLYLPNIHGHSFLLGPEVWDVVPAIWEVKNAPSDSSDRNQKAVPSLIEQNAELRKRVLDTEIERDALAARILELGVAEESDWEDKHDQIAKQLRETKIEKNSWADAVAELAKEKEQQSEEIHNLELEEYYWKDKHDGVAKQLQEVEIEKNLWGDAFMELLEEKEQQSAKIRDLECKAEKNSWTDAFMDLMKKKEQQSEKIRELERKAKIRDLECRARKNSWADVVVDLVKKEKEQLTEKVQELECQIEKIEESQRTLITTPKLSDPATPEGQQVDAVLVIKRLDSVLRESNLIVGDCVRILAHEGLSCKVKSVRTGVEVELVPWVSFFEFSLYGGLECRCEYGFPEERNR